MCNVMLFSHKKNEDQRHATTWMAFEDLRPQIKRFKFGKKFEHTLP
jgi:hypothetical protein